MQTEETKRQWMHVMERRSRDCQNLKSHVVERILDETQARGYLIRTSFMDQPPPKKVQALFQILFDKASDSRQNVQVRRRSFDLMQLLRQKLDDALKVPDNLVKSKLTASSINGRQSALGSNAPTSSQTSSKPKQPLAPGPSKPVGLPSSISKKSTAGFAAASAATSNLAASSIEDNVLPRPVSQSTKRPAPSNIAPPVYQRHSEVVVHTLANKKRIAPPDDDMEMSADDENENPKQTNSTTVQQQKGPAKKVKVTAPKVQRPPPIQPVLELDPRTESHGPTSWQEFPADTIPEQESQSRFSGSRAGRPPVNLEFTKLWPGNRMLAGAGAMFEQWEPFWRIEKVVVTGVTALVQNVRWMKQPTWKQNAAFTNIPRTVVSFEIPGFRDEVLTQINWGTTKIHANNFKPNNGDMALVLRMLPITIDKKYKRANCHLWPKGTFLTVNRVPVTLIQRKQTSHDATKWEQMSHPLDLSSHIRNPQEKTSIALCCQDDTQYLCMVAICTYQPPSKLLNELLQDSNPFLLKLSREESTMKAMGYINKNSMITIDDADGDGEQGVGKLVFSLVDPITKVPMKTPVRGQRCKHWQVRLLCSRYCSRL
jgi:hypothetical protein